MVHFVGAGPGAPDLITRRGAALLQEADCIIYAGSLVNPALLGLAKPGCAIYNSAEMTLEQVLDVMRTMEADGKITVRLHTGDPCLYGAIREQMDALDADGIALALRASVPIRVKAEVLEKAAREQGPGSIHPATRHHAGSDAATDMARSADARKEADTLAALLAKGAVPEDLGEAAGPERLRDLLRALEPASRNKM